MMLLFWVTIIALVRMSASSVDDWEAVGCFNNFDHSALPEHFYTPTDLDVNDLWPNLKPLTTACSEQAEQKNFSCFGIQYQQECWGGINASLTYAISGNSRNCRVGIDGYGVGKLYTSFVYKLRPVNGNWSAWSEWASCSNTCGEGLQMRRRNCTNPAPVNGGKPCKGVAMETKKCSLKLCPVNGNWSSWSEWAPCSKTCSEGLQKRLRDCTNPAPANSGKPCKGIAMETKSCSLTLCSVDGNWSSWSKWDPCSKTCGEGLQKRVRDCTHPTPANGGKPCKGVAMETKSCSLKPCPVHGDWSTWSTWTHCSKTCGVDFQKRKRYCTNPAPANGGNPCKGVDIETKQCSLQLCPVDGQWNSWSAWSACSVTCKDGIQRRRRRCTNPSPAHGGRDCLGVSRVTRTCSNGPCPADGGWSSWNNWRRCDKTCGGGTMIRHRRCSRPRPQHNGKPCVGQGVMTQSCNTYSCPPGKKLVLCERDMGTVIKCGCFKRIRLHWVHYGYISGDSACGMTHTYLFFSKC